MSAYTRKLILAAVVSLAGVTASSLWYKMADSQSGVSTSKILAHLESEKNEVQKRAVKKVIWQSIDEGEELHSGEAVRTSYDAEAKIIFTSGAEVDLDPDSVIVIEDSGNKVNLDFLKGNLFVKGSEGGGSDLALKSGDTSIAVKNSDMSLGKGTGSNVNVQVLRGVAEVNSGGKQVMLDDTKQGTIGSGGVDVTRKFFIKVNWTADQKVFQKPAEPTQFKWEGVSSDYQVHLEAGPTRASMNAVGSPVAGPKGVISAAMKPGTVYWRLVAVNKKNPKETHESFASKLVIVLDAPPRLLAPVPDQVVTLASATQGVDMRWANPSHLSKLQLEVARDSQFKNVVFNKFVEDTDTYSFLEKKEGEYYWRLAGYRAGKTEALVSEPQKFNLKTQFELASPEMKFPASGAHVAFEIISGGSGFFAWQNLQGVNHYHVKVDDVGAAGAAGAKNAPPVFDKDVFDVSQVKMPSLKPGHYRWIVTSFNDDGKESKAPAAHEFFVDQIPTLPWADGEQQETYYYVTEKPTLKPAWQKNAKERYDKFRVAVKSDAGFDKTLESNGVNPVVDLPSDGLFHVTVEALDAKGQVVARSGSKDFFVASKPLLPAPNFGDRMPASLQAQNNGSVSVNWKAVSGAKAYELQVKDGAGKLVKTEKFSDVSGKVKDLLPGQYKVSLSAIDQFGRVGPVGEEKELVVPDVSDARPPALKKIQIK